MKVDIIRRTVVGTLKTLCGTYLMLDEFPIATSTLPLAVKNAGGAIRVNVIDDEGFQNFIIVRGDFVIIPAKVPTQIDVKHALTDEEVVTKDLLTAQTID